MANQWIEHVKAYQNKHPDVSWKECMVKAKSSYKPKPKGGMAVVPVKGKRPKKVKEIVKEVVVDVVEDAVEEAVETAVKKRGRPAKKK